MPGKVKLIPESREMLQSCPKSGDPRPALRREKSFGMEECWVGRGEPGAGCRDVPAGWEQPVLPVLPASGKSLELQSRPG